jgi:hypothetical protein
MAIKIAIEVFMALVPPVGASYSAKARPRAKSAILYMASNLPLPEAHATVQNSRKTHRAEALAIYSLMTNFASFAPS